MEELQNKLNEMSILLENLQKQNSVLEEKVKEQDQKISQQQKEIQILEERVELLAVVDGNQFFFFFDFIIFFFFFFEKDGTKFLMKDPTKFFKVRQNTKRVFGKGELYFRRKIFAVKKKFFFFFSSFDLNFFLSMDITVKEK